MSGIRGVFLDPIHANIRNRIDIEERKYASKDPSIHQKTPWMRLTSNAKNVYDSETNDELHAKDWVLQGDVVKSEGLTPYTRKLSGWSTEEAGTQYSYARRNTPRPGITNVSIGQKGKLGSIQKASISITIPYEKDLELIEKFYMVPGVSCVLEWGWSDYDGGLLNILDTDTQPLIQDKILKKILSVDSPLNELLASNLGPDDNTAGKYGAMLGVIYSFQYSGREGGGYIANIELIAPSYFLAERPITTNYLPDIIPIKTPSLYESKDAILPGELIINGNAIGVAPDDSNNNGLDNRFVDPGRLISPEELATMGLDPIPKEDGN